MNPWGQATPGLGSAASGGWDAAAAAGSPGWEQQQQVQQQPVQQQQVQQQQQQHQHQHQLQLQLQHQHQHQHQQHQQVAPPPWTGAAPVYPGSAQHQFPGTMGAVAPAWGAGAPWSVPPPGCPAAAAAAPLVVHHHPGTLQPRLQQQQQEHLQQQQLQQQVPQGTPAATTAAAAPPLPPWDAAAPVNSQPSWEGERAPPPPRVFEPPEPLDPAVLALFAPQRQRMERATAKNLAAVSAKRKAEAEGLSYDYATGRVVHPATAQAAAAKKKKQGKNTSVYVSGLPRDVKETELAEKFGKLGALRRIKLYRMPTGEAKGDALVTYDIEAGDAAFGAERLLNGSDLRPGWRMSVAIAEFDKDIAVATAAAAPPEQTQRSSSAAGGPGPPAAAQRRVTLLRNAFSEADAAASGSPIFYTELEEDICTECGKCGAVLSVRALLRADTAPNTPDFVEGTLRLVFGRPADAEKCVALMNGRRFDGRTLVARVAVDAPGDPRPSGDGSAPAPPQAQLQNGDVAAGAPPAKKEEALLSSFLTEMEGFSPGE